MTIDEVDAASLSYEAFCTQYMACNKPVLIRNVVGKWFSNAREWKRDDGGENGAINFDYLRKHYGHHSAPVVDGDSAAYGDQEHVTMGFVEYLDLMESGSAGKKYLKDWHLVKAEQSNPPLYTTPSYFEDDWLNWWWDRKDQSRDDYRFVYIGPAGSWTPMHHDVFRSYSWSVNIVGCKEWIFVHPDDEWKLKDKFGRTVIPDITTPNYDGDMYPHADKARILLVTQTTGDAIFVPSGWYHQVKNAQATISINHNWFNGYNIHEIWAFLKREYEAVVCELAHLQEIGLGGVDFYQQCQTVMMANTGMNYLEFHRLLQAKEMDLATCLDQKKEEMEPWQWDAMREHLAKVRIALSELNDYFQDSKILASEEGC